MSWASPIAARLQCPPPEHPPVSPSKFNGRTHSSAEGEGFSDNLPKAQGISEGFLILFPSRVHPTRVSLATRKTRPFLNLSASLGPIRRSRSPRWGEA